MSDSGDLYIYSCDQLHYHCTGQYFETRPSQENMSNVCENPKNFPAGRSRASPLKKWDRAKHGMVWYDMVSMTRTDELYYTGSRSHGYS